MTDNNPNLQDGFKTILQAGINAIGGKADKASDFVDHVLKNVQIPDQFKNTIEDLATKGQDALKNVDMQGVFNKAQQMASDIKKDVTEVVGNVEKDAQSGAAHKIVMDTLEKLDHSQLSEVAEKVRELMNKRTGDQA